MRETSIAYRTAIVQNRVFRAKIEMTLADGTFLTLEENDLFSEGIQIDSGTSSTSTFDIGAAVIRQAVIQLNNETEQFSDMEFSGAQLLLFIGLTLADGSVEWLRKGRYVVSESKVTGIMVTLTALGCLSKADTPYRNVTTSYPATLETVADDICASCGIAFTTGFAGSGYLLKERPADETMSCREMLSYIAQLVGMYVWEDDNGKVSLKWYPNPDGLTESGDVDGGTYQEAESGDNVDGGTYQEAESGDDVDGGGYEELAERILITKLGSQSIDAEDVEITGIRVKINQTEEEVFYGNDSYVLEISENPLITSADIAETVAGNLYKMIGMKFRPLKVTAQSDPALEAGDVVTVIDRKCREYRTILTNVTFKLFSYETLECNAQSKTKNQTVRYGITTKTEQKLEQMTDEKIDAYDRAIQKLSVLIMNAMGFYETTQTDENGGKIYYMHDKPTLEESVTIWKKTIDAMAVSTDGGKTWNAGMTADGNMVVRLLTAIGISADWIQVGTLEGIEAILEKGSIGGWEIDKNALSRGSSTFGNADGMYFGADGLSIGDMIKLSKTSASGKFGNAENYALLDSGSLDFCRQKEKITSFSTATWSGTDTQGTAVHSNAKSKFITFGNRESDDEAVFFTKLMLNYGLNPDGRTEGVQVYADMLTDTLNVENSISVKTETGYLTCGRVNAWNGTALGLNTEESGTGAYVYGNFSCSGTKERTVRTEHYGMVGLTAYETATPYFGDIGSGECDEEGNCTIWLDEIFKETILTYCEYYIFLQPYGEHPVYPVEKTADYFVVRGAPGERFDWEIKGRQKDTENIRLEPNDIREEEFVELEAPVLPDEKGENDDKSN